VALCKQSGEEIARANNLDQAGDLIGAAIG
jgi:hypothetical protein